MLDTCPPGARPLAALSLEASHSRYHGEVTQMVSNMGFRVSTLHARCLRKKKGTAPFL